MPSFVFLSLPSLGVIPARGLMPFLLPLLLFGLSTLRACVGGRLPWRIWAWVETFEERLRFGQVMTTPVWSRCSTLQIFPGITLSLGLRGLRVFHFIRVRLSCRSRRVTSNGANAIHALHVCQMLPGRGHRCGSWHVRTSLASLTSDHHPVVDDFAEQIRELSFRVIHLERQKLLSQLIGWVRGRDGKYQKTTKQPKSSQYIEKKPKNYEVFSNAAVPNPNRNHIVCVCGYRWCCPVCVSLDITVCLHLIRSTTALDTCPHIFCCAIALAFFVVTELHYLLHCFFPVWFVIVNRPTHSLHRGVRPPLSKVRLGLMASLIYVLLKKCVTFV